MKSTPILMKGPLVMRTLSGEKTETRRLATQGEPCSYGQPGDRLWVRETWRPALADMASGYDYAADNLFATHADTPEACDLWMQRIAKQGGLESWRPSIFMPRDVCRLELELVSVRCERIQDITPEAVRAEGVASLELADLVRMGASWGKVQRTVRDMTLSLKFYPETRLAVVCDGDLILAWRVVWEIINGHRPGARWSDNPWVWVLGYKRVKPCTVIADATSPTSSCVA